MASGVETENGLAAAFDVAPVQAVLATRSLKADPGDLFLRTGSGRAKKNTLPHHIAYAATAMVTGNPKDAVANAKGFGGLSAGKIDGVIRSVTARKEDGTPSIENIVTVDMRRLTKPAKLNALLMGYDETVPVKSSSDFSEQYPEGESFIDAFSKLLLTTKERDRDHGLSDEVETEIWFTTRPFRHATIVYKMNAELTIKREFASVRLENAAQSAAQSAGFSTYGRVSYELIGWPALVAMARLVHLEEDQESLPNSNPPSAEGGAGDVETSADQKTEAVEAPPSTASDSLTHLQTGYQTGNKRSNKSSTLAIASLSHQEKGLGMLGVTAGLQEVNHL